MLKSTFFKKTGEHTYFTPSSIRWLFHCLTNGKHMVNTFWKLFALSAPTR